MCKGAQPLTYYSMHQVRDQIGKQKENHNHSHSVSHIRSEIGLQVKRYTVTHILYDTSIQRSDRPTNTEKHKHTPPASHIKSEVT